MALLLARAAFAQAPTPAPTAPATAAPPPAAPPASSSPTPAPAPTAPTPAPVAPVAPAAPAATAANAPASPAAAAASAPAVPAAAAPPAPTGPAKPEPIGLIVGGSVWSRYEARGGFEEHGLTPTQNARIYREGDYVVSRARFSLKTKPIDVGDGVEVSATFVPQAAYTWGENTGATPTVTDNPALLLYEGYASVGTKRYRLDVGRFSMNYGDALVIGDVGWNEIGRSFNGARLRLSPSDKPAYIDGFVTLINEGRLIAQKPVSGDSYFWGVYAGLGPLLMEKFDWDLYWLNFSTGRASHYPVTGGTPPTTVVGDMDAAWEVTLGTRVKGSLEPIDYRVEGGYQFGNRAVVPTFAIPEPADKKRSAYQLDAELGVTPVKGLRFGLEGAIASGDDLDTYKDEGYNELYPTGHKWFGLSDVIGPRRNLVTAVLHAKYKAGDAWSFLLDGHYFSAPEKNAAGEDGAIGEEVDVGAAYAIGAGAELKSVYCVFLPKESYWEAQSTSKDVAGNPIHYFELQFGIDFK